MSKHILEFLRDVNYLWLSVDYVNTWDRRPMHVNTPCESSFNGYSENGSELFMIYITITHAVHMFVWLTIFVQLGCEKPHGAS